MKKAAFFLSLCALGPPAFSQDQALQRVSIGNVGQQGSGSSTTCAVSANGRFVAFRCTSSELVGLPPGHPAVIAVRDRLNQTIQVVSTDYYGNVSNDDCNEPSLSADGRYVAFRSLATNFMGIPDSGPYRDIFVKDRATGEIQRVSESSNFGEANGHSDAPKISSDGRFVAFESAASNLVVGDTNGCTDIFVRELSTHTTARVSVSSQGTQGSKASSSPSISGDGGKVAFASDSQFFGSDTNQASDVFVKDLATSVLTRVSVTSGGGQADRESVQPILSADGSAVCFQSSARNLLGYGQDNNNLPDIYERSLLTGAVWRVSVVGSIEPNAVCRLPQLSSDGTTVVFVSGASNLGGGGDGIPRIYRWTRSSGALECISNPAGALSDAESDAPSIDSSGNLVAFYSSATNLALPGEDTNGQYDVYVSFAFVATERVSVNKGGYYPNAGCFEPTMDATGRYIAFTSASANLVEGDTNGKYDIFLCDRVARSISRVSTSSSGAQGNGDSRGAKLSANGKLLLFETRSSNFASDTNRLPDIYLKDLVSGSVTLVSRRSNGTAAGAFDGCISADGTAAAFVTRAKLSSLDTNGVEDVYVVNLSTMQMSLASYGSSAPADDQSFGPSLSQDGRLVAFYSYASNIANPALGDTDGNGTADVFLRDTQTGVTRLLSKREGLAGDDASYSPVISNRDGSVLFYSHAGLDPADTNGCTDIYRCPPNGVVARITSEGIQPDSDSIDPSISPNGQWLCFTSYATNILPSFDDTDDLNGYRAPDVYAVNLVIGGMDRVSRGLTPQGALESFSGVIDDSGRAAFSSSAFDLVFGSTANGSNIFVRGPARLPRRLLTSLVLSPSEAVGGASVQGQVFLNDKAVGDGETIYINAGLFEPGAAPGQVRIPAGSSSKTFKLVLPVVDLDSPLDLQASLGRTIKSGSILVKPGGMRTLDIQESAGNPGDVIHIDVGLSGDAPVGGTVVKLSSNRSALTVPASVIVPQGHSGATVNVTIGSVGTTTVATVTATKDTVKLTDTIQLLPTGATAQPPASWQVDTALRLAVLRQVAIGRTGYDARRDRRRGASPRPQGGNP